jgi:hypothetical protein
MRKLSGGDSTPHCGTPAAAAAEARKVWTEAKRALLHAAPRAAMTPAEALTRRRFIRAMSCAAGWHPARPAPPPALAAARRGARGLGGGMVRRLRTNEHEQNGCNAMRKSEFAAADSPASQAACARQPAPTPRPSPPACAAASRWGRARERLQTGKWTFRGRDARQAIGWTRLCAGWRRRKEGTGMQMRLAAAALQLVLRLSTGWMRSAEAALHRRRGAASSSGACRYCRHS